MTWVIEQIAAQRPDAIAHRTTLATLTYGELNAQARALAKRLIRVGQTGQPIGVYGHKEPEMLVAFLGCVLAGHPYVPIDSSLPPGRLAAIVEQSEMALLLTISDPGVALPTQTATVTEICSRPPAGDELPGIANHSPYYIIYTSGSTGTPKGVQITADNLRRFVEWGLTLVPPGPNTYLNQAPWSFDLSVMDTYLALCSGGTIFSLAKDEIAHPARLRAALTASEATVWVSTPSFADLSLRLTDLSPNVTPNVHTFLCCGETLTPGTATTLRDRFPAAKVFNTYGPTESTVAVTEIEITNEVLDQYPILPVGRAKPGTSITIRAADGGLVPSGATGEIYIHGDTVSPGYLGRPDLTASAFAPIDGQPSYRTGDAGRLIDDLLFFEGRLDFQIKLHGYRIELGDIEANLSDLDGVEQAVVLPVIEDGQVTHLAAHLVLSDPTAGGLKTTLALKKLVKESLPEYMVPKTFTYHKRLPLTANGKVDRRALGA